MNDRESRDLPTPQPLRLDGPVDESRSFFDRVLLRYKLIAVLVGIAMIIAVASGLLLWRASSSGPISTSPVPPSLRDLSAQYPELATLLDDPVLGSVYKDFLIAYENGGVEAARELAARRGLLNDRDEIRITLVVDSAEYVPALIQELQQVGVIVEGSYKERINIVLPLAVIEQLAAQQGVNALFTHLTQMGHIIRLELPAPRQSDSTLADGFQSEGVSITGAAAWHAAGITGQSIRIGVLDLGFDRYRAFLGTELPEQVVTASFIYGKEVDESGQVHGTACAEIVHEMAPDAELFLAAYDSTLVSMGQAVDWLLSQDVHIISNSTSGVVGPMDGSDEAASVVDDATRQGVLWVNSSGNAGDEHYRGIFTDVDGNGLHEFSDGTEMMALYVYAPELIVALNWDDWVQVTEDYDLFMYDGEGELVASSEDTQSGLRGQEAAELIVGSDLPEGIYYVAIKGHSTTRPATLDLYTLGASPEFPVAEHSLGSPADARGALAVGATEYRSDRLAVYSSQGPSNDQRLKPELSAPAGVSNAIYAPAGFDGTSASTPHVAGAAALVWSAFPEYNAGEVRDYLQTHALDLGPAGPDSGYGYGRLLLADPPGKSAGPVPTPTNRPEPAPTPIPGPTSVALIPESPEKPVAESTASRTSLFLIGSLGVCGGVVALGGGGLLLVALVRPSRRPRQAAVHYPPPPPSTAWQTMGPDTPVQGAQPAIRQRADPEYGVLVGAGLAPRPLQPGVTLVGRSLDNDIVLDGLLISRRHMRIQCSGGQCIIEDLGSANGLFVNGQRQSRAVLAPGDRLRLGDVELTYQAAGQAVAEAWLEMAGRRYPLGPAGTTIGRSQENGIHVGDERASRHHARIDQQQGNFVITDLGSANGTFVNGRRVQWQVLRDGDEIKIGDGRLYFGRTGGLKS